MEELNQYRLVLNQLVKIHARVMELEEKIIQNFVVDFDVDKNPDLENLLFGLEKVEKYDKYMGLIDRAKKFLSLRIKTFKSKIKILEKEIENGTEKN
jgi:hypothetical protein